MMIEKNGEMVPGARHDTMEISYVKTFGWENALRGMRFPKNSDSKYSSRIVWTRERGEEPMFGDEDLSLLLRLTKAGRDHRKALRMIHVQAALKMPISWWIQMDTYKVATVANSRSRMHKFGSEPLTRDDFYVKAWTPEMDGILSAINSSIDKYKGLADPQERSMMWREALDMLPMSYLQERMWDGNYETLVGMYHVRWSDKLSTEWRFFLETMVDECPALGMLIDAAKGGRSMTTEEFESRQIPPSLPDADATTYGDLIKSNRDRGHVK